MRIGFITGEYPPMQGGVGAHCRELARELSDQGHELFVFTDARAAEADTRIRLTQYTGRWRRDALRAINNWAAENRLDIVNLHFQTAAYQMSPFMHFLPDAVTAPVVTTFHDLRFPYLFPKAGPLRNWIVMRLARASEGVVSTNHEDFARLSHLPRAALIPIGSSVRGQLPASFDRDAVRATYGASPSEFVVAHFGFINHTKGVGTLLDAVATLGNSVRLWLIGGRTGASDPTNAANADAVEQQAAALGLSDRVAWTGFLDDDGTAAAFAASDVVALPFTDGASYRRSSLMAAIAHGCAIITTTPAVPIPTFRDGENLLLVPSNDEKSLAAALGRLRDDVALRARLRDGARELAEMFAWDGIARANAEFFARVVSEARK